MVSLALGACATARETTHEHVESSGDVVVAHEADGPNETDTLAVLAEKATTVVRGTVASISAAPKLNSDADLQYSLFTLAVTRVFRGEAPAEVIVAMATGHGGKELVIPGRPVPEEGDEAIWFLTRLSPEFGINGFVLTSTAGSLLLEADDGRLAITGDSPALSEAMALGSLDRVAAYLDK